MSKSTLAVFNALMRSDLRAFVRKVYATLKPNDPLLENWHIDSIVHELMAIHLGYSRRLIINIAPRSLKSMIVSVAFPAFVIGHDPSKTILVASHNQMLAIQLANMFRKVVNSDWYKEAFPKMREAPDKNSELSFVTAAGGGRHAVSVETGITGTGGDMIIIDDPIDAANAHNQAACAFANNWIDKSLSTRLNHPSLSPMILVMQRLSLYDTTAHFLEQGDWQQLLLPAKAEKTLTFPTGVGTSHTFEQGALLHQARMPQNYLDAQQKKMGDADYLAQFQQRPVLMGTGIIDIGKFQRFEKWPDNFDYKILSVDPASGTESGSYSVIQGYRVVNNKLYMTLSWQEKLSFPNLCDYIMQIAKDQKVKYIVVENAGCGIQVSEEILSRTPDPFVEPHLRTITPTQSKVYRMERAMISVLRGDVLIPEDEPWLKGFLDEIQAFPHGKYDDQVDAFSQAIKFMEQMKPPKIYSRVTMIPRGSFASYS